MAVAASAPKANIYIYFYIYVCIRAEMFLLVRSEQMSQHPPAPCLTQAGQSTLLTLVQDVLS